MSEIKKCALCESDPEIATGENVEGCSNIDCVQYDLWMFCPIRLWNALQQAIEDKIKSAIKEQHKPEVPF